MKSKRRPFLAAFCLGILLTALSYIFPYVVREYGTWGYSKSLFRGYPLTYLYIVERSGPDGHTSSRDFDVLALFGDIVYWSAVGFLALIWRSRSQEKRWSQAGQCTTCGYNLTGNTSGQCPECGLQIEDPEENHP